MIAGAWRRALVVFAAVLAADQAIKVLVRENVTRGDSDPIFPGVDLVHVENDGIAFGLASGGGVLIIALTSVVMAGLLVYFARNRERRGLWLPVGLLLGGAASNLLDRLVRGSVTDYIDLPLWPSFNLADVWITVGVFAMVYVLEGSRGRGEA